jgi:RimJ/RimL family protein N-acetyltransferase
MPILSDRLRLARYKLSDAEEIFASITPGLTRFMTWDPPESLEQLKSIGQSHLPSADQTDIVFSIRHCETSEFLGLCSIDELLSAMPELGIWIKESAHGHGFGREAVAALHGWASSFLDIEAFKYPVAEENVPSRLIAEALGGTVIGSEQKPKYKAVTYSIPPARS